MRFPKSRWFRITLIVTLFSVSIFSLIISKQTPNQNPVTLRSESPIQITRIQNYLQDQIDMGPRVPGSPASESFRDWISSSVSSDWNIEIQNYTYFTNPELQLRNYWITSSKLEAGFPKYIIGAHYDSRAIADKDTNFDSENPQLTGPVPGANDAASGVAGILELMNHLDTSIANNIGFVLFDAEDQGSGGIPGWPWIYGSNEFVDQMTEEQINATEGFILFDMIADDDLRLPWERNSDQSLITELWDQADQLGYGSIFVDEPGVSLIDDHIPFKQVGIPSIDIIDFTYPEHHTLDDNMDNISAENLAIVVDVTFEWILAKRDLFISSSSSSFFDQSSILPSTTGLTDNSKSEVIPQSSSSSAASFMNLYLLVSSVIFLSIKGFKRKLDL